MSRFGLEIRDETTFVVARRRWDNTVSSDANLIVSSRPDEGDLIYMPTVKKLFEISFVDHDDPFYQIDNLPVYKLYCRTFEYSSEVLDTGIYAIDDIETKKSTDFLGFEISGEQASGVIFNEKIGLECGTMYATGEGDVILEDDSFLLAENEEGFAALALEDSDEYYTFVVIQEAYSLATQDTQSENEWFEDRVTGIVGDPVLDFTESNAFGDPPERI